MRAISAASYTAGTGTLLTITDDFGGWGEANGKYFDEETGIVTKLLEDAGAPTE